MFLVAAESEVVTAWSACGWVHGFSWWCAGASFLHGSNNVLIPRGVFFDSKLFTSLNGSYDPNSPLSGANINGNDNKGTAHLNARVVQMVITKNATLAQASRVLDLAVPDVMDSYNLSAR